LIVSGQRLDVIVCGSLHLDIMLYASTFPRVDETVAGTRWEQRCGGKGGNQAVMAAKAGARVAMIGRVGADEFGVRLRTNLAAAAVDVGSILVDPNAGSGISAAIVREDGDYGAVIISGANLLIDPKPLEAQWLALGGARVLILQNEIPEAVNIAAARAARSAGALVVLNAAPARAMSPDLDDGIDLLVVNRIEAEMLTGAAVADHEDAQAALRRLGRPGRAVIITLGAGGVVVQPTDGEPTWIAPRIVKVVSTHGAGDCFVGVLAARLAGGEVLLDAAKAANAAAAAHVAGGTGASRFLFGSSLARGV
jgi:ribokinase